MTKFARYLPPQLIEALAHLAGQAAPNWRQEILANDNLHLAGRESSTS